MYTVVFGDILFKSGCLSGTKVCHVEADNFCAMMDEAFAQVFETIKIHGYSSLEEMRREATYSIYAIFSGKQENILMQIRFD